ncbi:hypothetical protein AT575_02905 [Streptococcus penaeicida]|uniref:GtrA/DPMS transmembrane domain-containing protein n=1 Tax=Streptococcus penaeicida TaxID=1765960 RepID=A0A2N8LD93_9STRE|nr:GtrA family protein [Streptococcus penaeicida]PND48127.1 hypothetical protein AT575_02905 [Streptococcus penaeicida]
MNINLKKLLKSEVVMYLIFGVLTTVVYIISRLIIFQIKADATFAAGLANIIAILFAFITNDTLVFKQERKGYLNRFIKFIIARLVTLVLDVLLAFIFVDAFPQIIGQFVHQNQTLINSIETVFGQVLVIVLNYMLSKLFVFNNKKS